MKQLGAEPRFQIANMTADCGLRDIQFAGSKCQAFQTGCRFEGAQRVEGRKFSNHETHNIMLWAVTRNAVCS